MPKTSAVGACSNHHLIVDKNGKAIYRMFRFPNHTNQPERRESWAKACGRMIPGTNAMWLPKPDVKYVYVCSEHFITGEPVNQTTHPDFVPSQNLLSKDPSFVTPTNEQKLRRYMSAVKRKLPVTPTASCTPTSKKVKRALLPSVAGQLPDGLPELDCTTDDQLHLDLTPLPLVPSSPLTSPSLSLMSPKTPKQPVEICHSTPVSSRLAPVISANVIISGQTQFSASDVETSRQISSVRIHIERVIGALKNRFAILQGTLSLRVIKSLKDEADSMDLTSADKLVRVCAILTNLYPSIVYNE